MATIGGKWRYVAAPKRNDISQTDRGNWSEKKRLEALSIFIATGSITMAATQANIPFETVKAWSKKDWWKEKIRDIQNEDYDKMDAKLTKALDKALDSVMDRIENGEYIYDPKTGKTKLMPAKLRDLNTAFNSLMDKRQLIRKQPTKIIEQSSTAQALQNLADHFAQFTTGKIKKDTFNDLVDVIDAEIVEQSADGTYVLKDTDNAIHDQWKAGLPKGESVGPQTQEREASERQSTTELSESQSGRE